MPTFDATGQNIYKTSGSALIGIRKYTQEHHIQMVVFFHLRWELQKNIICWV